VYAGWFKAVKCVKVVNSREQSGIWVTCVYGSCGWLRCSAVVV